MAIEWDESLATGNREIDYQHKELFSRFDSLLTACNNRKGKEEVLNLLTFLGDYVQTHFALEERLQKEHSYPGYPEHKGQHEGFIRDLQNLEQQVRDDGATLSLVIQTNQTMAGWLINHINITDRELANFLRLKT
jgi:hemerythrin